MTLKLVTAPTVEPITWAQAQAHLRAPDDDEDLVTALIGAVRQHIDGPDGLLQRALVTQTWDLYLDKFPCSEIRIPLPPLQSVVSVKYDDKDGNEQTVSDANYSVDTISQPGWLLPDSGTPWPTTFNGVNAVRVRFIAGYPPGTDSPVDLAANVPLPIKQWMLLQIGTFYLQRETLVIGQSVQNLPWMYEGLLQGYRVYV